MAQKQSKTRPMTEGSILRQIILFSLPLMLGNVFQMLYNTVDSIVVGNFVGKEALAAVGSTTMIVNMLVFFFNGFSVGASVVIGQRFGAKDMDRLHTAVQTTMTVTFILAVLFSGIGVLGVKPMLRFMSTPDDVFADAVTYLSIYFAGLSGLLIYNMGAGILRAVGDSTRPLIFLVFTSLLNTALDLLFVIVLKMGIAGVAVATIISQAVSAVLILILLVRTKEVYKLNLRELGVDWPTIRQIVSVGLPAGIQQVITAFSNIFVQSYINYFGSSVMAGWSSYNKLDSFIMLPMQSMAVAATTFVSQNIGAGQEKLANRGTVTTILLAISVTAVVATFLVIFAEPAVGLFSGDREVIDAGALFIHTNTFFLLFNCVNHTLAGALRGRGDSRAPMIIMLSTFVGMRQLYLFLATRLIENTPKVVGFGYPVGWTLCFVAEVSYFVIRHVILAKKKEQAA